MKKSFIVHGRWDNKYLGSKPEFQESFNTFKEAKTYFYDQIRSGAGTIFFEQYDEWMQQIRCFNKGHNLVEVQ